MSTAIIHGDPGAFKTAVLINDYLVPAIKSGRVVVTNIRGVKSVEEIGKIYNFEVPQSSQIILVPFNTDGFNLMARFFHWVPNGSLILMDEGQRVYETRLNNFKAFDLPNAESLGRPSSVENAFDTHRHMNWDIYITTPSISKIHKEIRGVAEFGFRHKNLATVFSFTKGWYKRVTHSSLNNGEAFSNAISSSLKRIDKRCFDVYQSTATGQTKDSSAGFSFFKQPKVLLLLLIIIGSLANGIRTLVNSGGLPAMFGGHTSSSANSSAEAVRHLPTQTSSRVSARGVPNRVHAKNPFSGLTFFYVADLPDGMLFEIQMPDSSLLTFKQDELKLMGYKIVRLNRSSAQLTFNDEVFYAFEHSRRPVAPHQNFTSPDPTANLANQAKLVTN